MDWISKSLSSVTSGSLFSSLKTRRERKKSLEEGDSASEKGSEQSLKPSAWYGGANSGRKSERHSIPIIEATTTIYQETSKGTYKANVLPPGV